MGQRLRLAYTVDEEDAVAEVAKIINLSADDMQKIVDLFNQLQVDLRPSDSAQTVNMNKCFEIIDKFRLALFNVDTKLGETTDMLRALEGFQRDGFEPSPQQSGSPALPSDVPPPDNNED